jgi:hypothetical protein
MTEDEVSIIAGGVVMFLFIITLMWMWWAGGRK